jgi:hypothetical protein
MYQLHIEHAVMDYDRWKQAFDSDPVDRKKMGVRSFRILRPVDQPNFVIIELNFTTAQQAGALLAALRNVWKDLDGKVILNPQARISEIVHETNL